MSWLDALRAAYGTILGGGTAVPQRGAVNFAGSGATVTDDPVTKTTTVTITGGGIGPLTPLRSVVSDSGGAAVSGQAITTAATADTLALRDGGGGLAITTLARTYESAPGITDARLYATGNGSTNDLAALQTAAAAQPRLHWSPGAYKVATTGSIGTANSSVHSFEPGAVVHAVAATPVTLAGQIDAADDQQIFSVDAPGAILLPDVAVVHPGWFGAGMGASNDAVALNSSFAACADGATVQLRPVVHKVTAPLTTTKRHNIIGHGPTSVIQVAASVGSSTDILTIAPAASAVPDGVVWSDFAILPASGTPGRHGIVIDTTADASGIARMRIVRVVVGQLGGNGIKTINLPAKADGWFTSSIEECTLHGGGINMVNSGDSISILRNEITGAGWGLEIQSVHLKDRPDSIKTIIATSASPQTYSGGALNGAIGSTFMVPGQRATVTTSAHAATYNTGSPIVVNGTDASNNPLTDNLTLLSAGGGETIVGTQHFKTITSIVVPAQSGTLGAFTFGSSPDFPSYASIVEIEGNNITGAAGTALVHSGDQVNFRNNNSEQFGSSVGFGAIDLRGDWAPLRAPSVKDSYVNSGNAPAVIYIDQCLWAKVARCTFGRSIGGLIGIDITANAQNTILEENLPGSVEDYDVDFIHDAGLNTSVWGKYAVGVGGFDGTSVGQPSAGNAATMIANLGAGNNGTIAVTVSKNVTTQSFVWSPKTSDVNTNDIDITAQGPFASATSTNRDSGAFVFHSPSPASGGVNRPWAIILGGVTRFQVGDGGAFLFAQTNQNALIGDIDNSSIIKVGLTGAVFEGGAALIRFAEFNGASISQDQRTSDNPTFDIPFIGMAPYASATGTNRNSGGFVFQAPLPVAGGVQGAFTVEIGGANRIIIDGVSTRFYKPDGSQPARSGQLTDSSGGVSGGNTIAVIGGAVDPTAALKTDTANAIATLAARLNLVEASLSAAGPNKIGITQ